VSLLNSVNLNGYKPRLSNYSFPEVVILQNKLGEVRFTQMDGAHRLAILSALGYERVIVKLDMERYPPILEDDVENWPYVKSGLINRADALKLFNLYFKLDGTERMKKVFQ
jgi:hypothetical protein